MQDRPLVTVGILSYNQPDDVRRAIESVVAQTYTNLEILVSDNGSEAKAAVDVVREFAVKDPRLKPFYHKLNKGPHFSLRFLVQEAKGEFFCWLAGDDAFSLNYIEDCVRVLEADQSIVAAADMPMIAHTGMPMLLKHMPDTVGLKPADKYRRVIDHGFSDMNLFYYSLIRLPELRKCHLHLKRLFGGDLLLLLELLPYGDIAVNKDRPGLVYTLHEGQVSSSPIRYKQIVTKDDAGYWERHLFFTAYVWYMITLVWRAAPLSFAERISVTGRILSRFFSSNRYHLIKYDLGIHRIVALLKRLLQK